MLLLNVLKTSEPFALVRKDSDTKDHLSTELLLNLWHKEETSLLETEQVENLFTEINSLMRTSL
jgi:hypothetical protein